MPDLPRFQNVALLHQALTHKSYRNEHPELVEDNQRLEFLGDAILGFLVGELLYRCYPNVREGELTRRRSMLVDQPRLATLARSLNLGSQLRIGRGVERDGGRQNASILSDAFEAMIGAYFLDAGIEAVQGYVEQLFLPLAEALNQKTSAIIDPKSLFQQWALAHLGPENPHYQLLDESGPDHAKTFTVEVRVGDRAFGQGCDRSKREAEKRAAEAALRHLGIDIS